MAVIEIVKVVIRKGDLAPREGEVKIGHWDKKDRIWRSLRVLAICWTIAVGCVLVPILHFVLVPFFLIIGPVLSWAIFMESRGALGGSGICPECGREFSIVEGKLKFPFSDVCNHCRAHVEIDLINSIT